MTRVLLTLAAVAVAQTGCSSARYVHRGADEGVVAVPDRSNDWPTYNHDKATKLITEHVGPDYEIVEEWSEKTGEQVRHDQDSKREQTFNTSMPFLPADKVKTQTTTTVSDLTEWRIKYRKRAAGVPGTSLAGGVPVPAPGAAPMSTGVVLAGATTVPGPSGVIPAGGVMPPPTIIPPPVMPTN